MANPATDELRLRASVFDALGAALVGIDTDGRTIFWSPCAERLFGWTAEEVLGRIPPIVPPPLHQEWHIQVQRVLASRESTAAAETQRVTRDGRLVPVVRSSTPLHDPNGACVGVLDTLMDITLLKQLDDESRALAQVRERELIAMDLHDGLLQGLYGVMLALDTRRRALDPPHASAEEALSAARAELERLVEETRGHLFDLRSRQFAPRDLGSGMRLLADGLRLNGNLKVELNFDLGVEPFLQPEVRGHLLYLAREAIANILRHAHATTARITVARTQAHIVLIVEDDGVGFAVPRGAGPRDHHGLRNMAERARLIGGKLRINSQPGGGAQVSVETPIFSAARC